MLRTLEIIVAVVVMLLPGIRVEADEGDELREQIAEAMAEHVVIPYSRKVGRPRPWPKYTRVPGGYQARFRAFAWSFVRHGRRRGLDPWILAAQSWLESTWNPAVSGEDGEQGILQLLPRWRGGLAFFAAKRECLQKTDACQDGIIARAADILGNSVQACGGLEGGLARYNTGRCDSERGLRYARSVLRVAAKLKTTTCETCPGADLE